MLSAAQATCPREQRRGHATRRCGVCRNVLAHATILTSLAVAIALALICTVVDAAPAPDKPGRAEGVAFLPLAVTSDESGLGDQVQQMLRFKAKRLGAVVYDASSIAEALGGRTVSPRTPHAELAALGRDTFKADVVVTGHVAGREPYEVRLRAVYTGRPGQPGVFEQRYACANHHVIAVEMANAVYDILGMDRPDDPLRLLRADPEIDRRWREAPNLVKNPGFEQRSAAGNGPVHWQPIEKTMAWTANPEGPGKVVRFEMDEALAGGYGLDFYSDWIPIEAGATYRFSCRYRSLAPTAKIFLKGYHWFETTADGYPAQYRETYRRQVHPSGPAGRWNTVTADFIPESTRPEQTPTVLKVDLYAYWPAGVIFWDDVVLKKVRDAPPAKTGAKAAPAAGPKAPKGSP